MKEFAFRMLAAYGGALVLMFFSEYFFINEEPVFGLIDTINNEPWVIVSGYIEFGLYYTLFTYPFLMLMSLCNVRTLAGLMLAGSIFGWMTEGVIIPVVYENMPFSFAFTSISVHAVIDVTIGWYLVRHVMRHQNIVWNAVMFVILGAAWGAWATWYWADSDAIAAILPADFTKFSFVTSAFWIVGMVLADRFGRAKFTATKWEVGVVGLITIPLFALMAFPYLPFSLALLPLIAITVFALYYRRNAGGADTVLRRLSAVRPKPWAYPLAFLTPLTASVIYPWFHSTGTQVATDLIVTVVFIGGVIWFVAALSLHFVRGRS